MNESAWICVRKTKPALTHTHTHTPSEWYNTCALRRVYLPIAREQWEYMCACVYDSSSGNIRTLLSFASTLRPRARMRACIGYVSLCLSVPLGVCVCAHDLYLNIFVLFSLLLPPLLPLLFPHAVVILFALRFSAVHSVLWFRTLHTRLPFYSLFETITVSERLTHIHTHTLKQRSPTDTQITRFRFDVNSFKFIIDFNWFFGGCCNFL